MTHPRTHDHLWSIVSKLDSDYEPYGRAERDGLDCSCGCRWFATLEDHPYDWGVCTKRTAPRCGLLTFEHQNGLTCFERDPSRSRGELLPIVEYPINDGDTIYLAIQAKYADRLPELAAAIPASLSHLRRFRLVVLVFSDHLEQMSLFNETCVRVKLSEQETHEGGALDPVIGVILADHVAVSHYKRPPLFVFSDGNVTCHWNYGVLSQLIHVTWLNEETTEPMLTPFGDRRVITLQPRDQQPDDNPAADS